MCTLQERAAGRAGRRTCVRWRARISARPNASRMRARPSNTTNFQSRSIFFLSPTAERARSRDVGTPRVRRYRTQKYTATSDLDVGWQPGGRDSKCRSSHPRLLACFIRPSTRGVIPSMFARFLCFRDASVWTRSAEICKNP